MHGWILETIFQIKQIKIIKEILEIMQQLITILLLLNSIVAMILKKSKKQFTAYLFNNQKSGEFLYGPPTYSFDKDHENEAEHAEIEEKQENDDLFFSSVANSIHEDDQDKKDKADQGNGFGFEDPFFQPYTMTTSTEKQKFEGFEFFDVQKEQDQAQENEKSKQTFDDIFNSFQFTTSPQISPHQPDAADFQNNQNQNQKDNEKNNNNNSDGMEFFLQ